MTGGGERWLMNNILVALWHDDRGGNCIDYKDLQGRR